MYLTFARRLISCCHSNIHCSPIPPPVITGIANLQHIDNNCPKLNFFKFTFWQPKIINWLPEMKYWLLQCGGKKTKYTKHNNLLCTCIKSEQHDSTIFLINIIRITSIIIIIFISIIIKSHIIQEFSGLGGWLKFWYR